MKTTAMTTYLKSALIGFCALAVSLFIPGFSIVPEARAQVLGNLSQPINISLRVRLDGEIFTGELGVKAAIINSNGVVRWASDGSSGEPDASFGVFVNDGQVVVPLGDTDVMNGIPVSIFGNG